MKIYYSETHKQHAPPFEFTGSSRVPTYETPERAENVLAELQKTGWADILTPTDFGLEPVLSVHSQPYLDYLRTVYQREEFLSPVPGMALIPGTFDIDYETVISGNVPEQAGFFYMDTAVSYTNGTYAAALDAANCAISGAEAITQGQSAAFALCRPPGHHAGREICGGYCYLNNAAIAAQWLSKLGRVVILDVDFHAGNGTQEIFYDRPDVYMISIHADPGGEYPYFAGHAWEKGMGPGLGYHQNFPLSPGTGDAQYLEVLDQALVLIDRFSPQHLVVSSGMDIYKDDPLGSFKLTQQGIRKIGERISTLNLPTLVVMEGGYHLLSLGANMTAFLEALGTRKV